MNGRLCVTLLIGLVVLIGLFALVYLTDLVIPTQELKRIESPQTSPSKPSSAARQSDRELNPGTRLSPKEVYQLLGARDPSVHAAAIVNDNGQVQGFRFTAKLPTANGVQRVVVVLSTDGTEIHCIFPLAQRDQPLLATAEVQEYQRRVAPYELFVDDHHDGTFNVCLGTVLKSTITLRDLEAQLDQMLRTIEDARPYAAVLHK